MTGSQASVPDKIRELLAHLPLRPGVTPADIKTWVTDLFLTHFNGYQADHPNNQPGSKATSLKCIDKACKHAQGLLEALYRMPAEAAEAKEKFAPFRIPEADLLDELNYLIDGLRKARADVEAMPAPSAKKGARKKVTARLVTDWAGNCYESITGRDATVSNKPNVETNKPEYYSPFLDFLTALFDLFDIDAKPVSQAQRYVAGKSAKKT